MAAVLEEKGAETHPPASLSRPDIEMPVSVAACGYPNPLEALQDDRYFARMADSLHLTAEQRAELEAIRMLADPRFTPHLSAEEFSQNVRAVLSDHHADRLITSTEIVDILAAAGMQTPDISVLSDEFLAENERAVEVMGDDQLRVIAHELLSNLKENVNIDWAQREPARAACVGFAP